MELVTPGIGLMFWTLVSFIVVFFLLKKFAWKPILGTVNNREKTIVQALESAEAAKREMENLKADNERILQEARTEREAMLKEAREIKTKIIAEAKEEANKTGDKMISQAQEVIATEKRAAVAELKNQVVSLSVEIAEKVLQKQLDNKKEQMELVDGMLEDVTLIN